MLRLEAERRRHGWRQQDLAYYANVPVAEVSRIETGRMDPYPTHRERLAKALGIAPDQLTVRVRAGSEGKQQLVGRRSPAKPFTD